MVILSRCGVRGQGKGQWQEGWGEGCCSGEGRVASPELIGALWIHEAEADAEHL